MLERAWVEARQGVLQLVLVCGGAGAGKSRLVCEAANTFHRQGAAVLAGGCNADFARPYDPVAEPVRVLLPWTAQGHIQLGDEVAAQADVVDRLRVVAGGESGGPLPSTRLLFDAVSRLIVAATAPRPLVVVLEDLHWAAQSGTRLVVHLAEAVTDVPLLVLATLRTTGSTSDDPPALAGLYRLPGSAGWTSRRCRPTMSPTTSNAATASPLRWPPPRPRRCANGLAATRSCCARCAVPGRWTVGLGR